MFEAHFQTFEEPESGVALTARLSAFREELARRKLTGFVIPRADQQQNEYVAPSAERLAAACAKPGAELVAVAPTPLDSIWTERPPPPLAPAAVHGTQFSGEIEAEKLNRIRSEIAKLGVDALVLSDSHAVAWSFNIRGADVSHTPLPLSYALVPKDGRPTIFIDHRKLSNSVRDNL